MSYVPFVLPYLTLFTVEAPSFDAVNVIETLLLWWDKTAYSLSIENSILISIFLLIFAFVLSL